MKLSICAYLDRPWSAKDYRRSNQIIVACVIVAVIATIGQTLLIVSL